MPVLRHALCATVLLCGLTHTASRTSRGISPPGDGATITGGTGAWTNGAGNWNAGVGDAAW